jgi:replication factor C subunit 3/5
MTNMRLILCASSTSKIIAPIRSRCLLVRVAAPDESEVGPSPYLLFGSVDRYF